MRTWVLKCFVCTWFVSLFFINVSFWESRRLKTEDHLMLYQMCQSVYSLYSIWLSVLYMFLCFHGKYCDKPFTDVILFFNEGIINKEWLFFIEVQHHNVSVSPLKPKHLLFDSHQTCVGFLTNMSGGPQTHLSPSVCGYSHLPPCACWDTFFIPLGPWIRIKWVIPLPRVLPLQSEPIHFSSVQFNVHSALMWSVSIMLSLSGRCVCFTSESCLSADTVHRQLQTDSLQYGGLMGPFLSWVCIKHASIHMHRPTHCMHMHTWMHVYYVCSACASIFLWQVSAWSPGCVHAFNAFCEHVGS